MLPIKSHRFLPSLVLVLQLTLLQFEDVSCMGGLKIIEPTTKTEGIVVKLPNGEIKGHTDISRGGRKFYGFAGIPYAEAPVRGLRFEPPVPAGRWNLVKNVYDYGEPCAQIDRLTKNIKGSEDCLFINVFSPKNTNRTTGGFSDVPLPVLVFIHGGSYSYGSANAYEPHYFMDEDVVFVSFNYRLASLGFLNTEDGLVRGNMGMKDQVLALKWVQENINLFGGDPTQVTLLGQSAGAGSVQYHLLSSMSKDLFQKAISMSGSAIKPFALQERPIAIANRFGELVNCPVDNTTVLVSCLRNLSVDTIMTAHFEDQRGILRNPLSTFSPSIETTHEGAADTFLSEHPYAVLNSGRQNRVPWMSGVNSEEGLIVSARILNDKNEMTKINKYWKDLAPKFLLYDPTRTDITAAINKFYFDIEDSSQIDFEKQFKNFTNLFSDRYYMFPYHDSVSIQSKYSPVYLYYNNYQGKVSLTDVLSATSNFPLFAVKKLGDLFKEKVLGVQPEKLGVCHADDLPLLFKLDPADIPDSKHPDFEHSVQLVKLWVQFANDESTLSVDGTQWTKVGSSADLEHMKFTNKGRGIQTMIVEPMKERMEFWNGLKLFSYGSTK